MPDAYHQLLEATIQHLEQLKAHGVMSVSLSRESLTQLAIPPMPRKNLSPTINTARPVVAPAASVSTKASPPISASITPIVDHTKLQTVPAAPGTIVIPVRANLSAEAKSAAFAELRARALTCTRCSHLVASRKQVVFGVGNINSPLMFVGEAPGADEDDQGEPFVGKAGQLLTKIIQAMGLSRDQVYIGNILKCRPDTPGQTAGNRKPTPAEMKTCIPYLHEQIDLIQPKVLVALGATAVEGLLERPAMITKTRGTWQTYRGIPLMPTYHPSYLLRNQALAVKREVWEDMLAVMEKLEMPITEKQRGFFLKA